MSRPLQFRPLSARSLTTLVATASVLLTLSVLWAHGRHDYYMPCETDCGETIIAQDQVALYRLNGFNPNPKINAE